MCILKTLANAGGQRVDIAWNLPLPGFAFWDQFALQPWHGATNALGVSGPWGPWLGTVEELLTAPSSCRIIMPWKGLGKLSGAGKVWKVWSQLYGGSRDVNMILMWFSCDSHMKNCSIWLHPMHRPLWNTKNICTPLLQPRLLGQKLSIATVLRMNWPLFSLFIGGYLSLQNGWLILTHCHLKLLFFDKGTFTYQHAAILPMSPIQVATTWGMDLKELSIMGLSTENLGPTHPRIYTWKKQYKVQHLRREAALAFNLFHLN